MDVVCYDLDIEGIDRKEEQAAQVTEQGIQRSAMEVTRDDASDDYANVTESALFSQEVDGESFLS